MRRFADGWTSFPWRPQAGGPEFLTVKLVDPEDLDHFDAQGTLTLPAPDLMLSDTGVTVQDFLMYWRSGHDCLDSAARAYGVALYRHLLLQQADIRDAWHGAASGARQSALGIDAGALQSKALMATGEPGRWLAATPAQHASNPAPMGWLDALVPPKAALCRELSARPHYSLFGSSAADRCMKRPRSRDRLRLRIVGLRGASVNGGRPPEPAAGVRVTMPAVQRERPAEIDL